MVQYIPVQMVDGGVVDVRRKHAFAEVVEDNGARDSAESAEGFLVQFRPDLRTGTEHQEPDAYSGRSGPLIPLASGPPIPVGSGPPIPPACGPPIPVGC